MSKRTKKQNVAKKSNSRADIPEKSAAIRTFNVFVDGEFFEVGVDEIGGAPVIAYTQPSVPVSPAMHITASTASVVGSIPPPPPPAASASMSPIIASAPAAPSKPVAAKASAAPSPVSSPSASGTAVKAPMPGMIIKYKKNQGDAVKKGEAVVILEAMKMENALVSPADGVIKEICCNSGDSVSKDTVLALIE
ncbi:MAG: hypothetical protein QM498_09795 [Desulfobacterium sp.]